MRGRPRRASHSSLGEVSEEEEADGEEEATPWKEDRSPWSGECREGERSRGLRSRREGGFEGMMEDEAGSASRSSAGPVPYLPTRALRHARY